MHQTVAAQHGSWGKFLEPQVSEDWLAVLEDFAKAAPAQRLQNNRGQTTVNLADTHRKTWSVPN